MNQPNLAPESDRINKQNDSKNSKNGLLGKRNDHSKNNSSFQNIKPNNSKRNQTSKLLVGLS